jgi:hypothetical protein
MSSASPAHHDGKHTPSREVSALGEALLSLLAATLSPWMIHWIDPQPRAIDEVAVEVVSRIKDRLVAKARGEPYIAPAEPDRFDAAQWYAGCVIAAAGLAICVGVIGLVCRHHARLNTAIVAVAAAAIVFQYMLILAAALLLVLLVGLVLWSLPGGT